MRRNVAVLLSVIFLVILTSCGNEGGAGTAPNSDASNSDASNGDAPNGDAPKKESVRVSEITAAIIEGGDFPEMTEKTADDLADKYFDLDTSGVTEASFYVNPAGTNPDEIAVIKMGSAQQAQEAKAVLETYVQGRIKSWRDYVPAQVYKLDGAVIEAKGEYVVLFVCDDGGAAEKIFAEMIS
ncbi:MAG: DUF4358 domain-containing protein [Oscillospiraceae bacterium]|jgi:hypothetical protein|nr:DUF4358 domain-containing protein [Oscillospiraceae bacterium]